MNNDQPDPYRFGEIQLLKTLITDVEQMKKPEMPEPMSAEEELTAYGYNLCFETIKKVWLLSLSGHLERISGEKPQIELEEVKDG